MTEWPDMEKDITAAVTVEEAGVNYEDPEDDAGSWEDEEKDHPAIAFLDIAVSESVRACEKENLPKPNLALWESFSRGMMNRALWHYVPDDEWLDSPALCLALGVGGLSACYIPVIISLYEKSQSKEDEKKNPPESDVIKVDQSRSPSRTPPKNRDIRPVGKPEEPKGDPSKVMESGKMNSRINRMSEYAKAGF